MPGYEDYPKAELVATANAIVANDPTAKVFFKATCPRCGARPAFQEPNVCFDEMECCDCGHSFPYIKGNYMVMRAL